MRKDLGRHFSKADPRTASQHVERCSRSLGIRELQIKTTTKQHVATTEVVMRKTRRLSSIDKATEGIGAVMLGWGRCPWGSHVRKQSGTFSNGSI